MPQLSVITFGGIEIYMYGQLATPAFRTRKATMLLVYLMAESQRSHTREFLAELFWPEKPEGIARTNLRQALAGIKKIIPDQLSAEPYLITTRESIQFNQASDYWLDEKSFKGHFKSVQTHAHTSLNSCQSCIQHLLEANALYGGEYLAEWLITASLELKEWIICRREQYFRLMLGALQQISQYFNQLGDHETAIRFARQLVNLDPLEEGEHQNLMYLLAISGHRSAALNQYQQCHQLLSDELNIEPSPATTDLYERIKSGLLFGVTEPQPPLTSLPIHLTSFIGRQADLDEMRMCFQNPVCRLLTLVGFPGSGKTRLAMQVADEQLDHYPDGVWFISLETRLPGQSLVTRISASIGFTLHGPSESYTQQLIGHLRPKKTLLVLDNFDDWIGETNFLVSLLNQAHQVRVLLTSQIRLNYQSACYFKLDGLPYPLPATMSIPEESEAVQLFIDRARRVRSDFNPSKQDLSQIIRICQMVEGNPLAIELAANRLRRLPVGQIADHLEKSMEVLSTTLNDIPPRQRSMWASLDRAWERLTPAEKKSLAKLSSFASTFTPADAFQEGVKPDDLISLANKSLVENVADDTYALPNLARSYAAERLVETLPHDHESPKGENSHHEIVSLKQIDNPEGMLTAQQYLIDRLAHILKRAQRQRNLVAIMIHDINLLDSSSPIHIKQLSKSIHRDIRLRVETTLRQSDTIYSTGLSPLIIIIEDLADKRDATIVAQKINKDSQAVMANNYRDIMSMVNIGISLYPQDGDEPQTLLSHAHEALSRAKKSGDCLQFYANA